MRAIWVFFIFYLISIVCYSQNNDSTVRIVAEGKMLYQCEMASWYGSDIFMERFREKKQNFKGYFSYVEKDITRCVFYSKDDNPKILVTVSFDSTYDVSKAKVDGVERNFTQYESQIRIMREKAIAEINQDTLFKSYNNTKLNLVPLITDESRKVFVLTGPQVNGVVVLGNDYVIEFDQNLSVQSKKQLHKNIIPIYYKKDEVAEISMHSHLPETGDYITSTDICTLMLYSKFAKWKQHYVLSRSFVSIWDCHSNSLAVLTREAWEKINKD